MGLYKLCNHRGRARDRCEHAWWGCFRGRRVSLEKWTNRLIETKEAAQQALEDLRAVVRAGTFNRHGLHCPTATDLRLTFGDVADRYLTAYPHDDDKKYYLALRGGSTCLLLMGLECLLSARRSTT